MKFTSVFALVATAATLAGAVPFETNAERLARGLPPLPPARRASGVEGMLLHCGAGFYLTFGSLSCQTQAITYARMQHWGGKMLQRPQEEGRPCRRPYTWPSWNRPRAYCWLDWSSLQ